MLSTAYIRRSVPVAGMGTEGSNPAPSSGESANHPSLSGGRGKRPASNQLARSHRRCWIGLAMGLRADLLTRRKRGAVLAKRQQPEWRTSLGWWFGGDGIMRCRS